MCRRRSGAECLRKLAIVFATDVFPPGRERADDSHCSLPPIVRVTVPLRAEPKIDRLAHDRGV